MRKINGWLKFNENKDEECPDCKETPCTCKEDEDDENESFSSAEFEAEYDALSIEEKKAIPEGFKKFLKKGKGKKKDDDKKDDKKGGKKGEKKDDKKGGKKELSAAEKKLPWNKGK